MVEPENQQTGRPRGGGPLYPKGRQLDDTALSDVRTLLGGAPRERHYLIEHLHILQDRYGHLSARHLRALAHEMHLSQAEIYETASFYHHFDIVREADAPPPPLTIRVCDSVACMMAGAEALIDDLRTAVDPAAIRILPAPCMGRCDAAPVAQVGRRSVGDVNTEMLLDLAADGAVAAERPAYTDLAAYRAQGGYKVLEACLAGQRSAQDVIATLSDAGLRGMGGAGFPAGQKWSIVRSFDGPRLMTVNGDEGEPGTFKDRVYLESDPHRMLEGALIGAWAVEAKACYIYMRDEYPAVLDILAREIAALDVAGLTDHCRFELRRGAGAYICGEESAMLESIEGKRGLPRHRPPYIAEVGLFGRPTLNHNVETLYWVPEIIEKGPEWFAGQGDGERKGLRSYSVSGRVARPGVKLAPAGITFRRLIEEYCGGMAEGHTLKGFLPGGASGGIFPASFADTPLDFGSFEPHGGFVGSHAVVVLSQADSVRSIALNLMRFYEHESCGQCTPCRSGTQKMVVLLQDPDANRATIEDLCQVMADASICGLGQAAPNPVIHLMRYFPEDL